MSGCPGGYEDDSDYDDVLYVEEETSQEPQVSQCPEKPACRPSKFGLSRPATNTNNSSVIQDQSRTQKVVPKKKKNKRTNAIPLEIIEKMGSVDSCFQKVLHTLQSSQTNQRILLNELAHCWTQCSQPFQSCLSVLIHTNNLKYGLRNKFHNILLNSLNDYKQKNPTLPGPSNAFKKTLFTFLFTSNFIPDFSNVIQSFELVYCSNGKFTDRNSSSCEAFSRTPIEDDISDENLSSYIFESIQQLITIKNYLKASRFIASMHLHEKYPSNEICMGLLLQGYPVDLEKYIKEKRDVQISLIEYIDQLLKDSPASLNKLISDVGVVKMDIANEKAISKFAVKIIKLFNIPETHCPNIVNMQVQKAIKYLVVKKFILKEMGCEEWEDLVSAIVEGNPSLQLYLIISLSDVYELEVAARMAVKYKIPREKLGEEVAIYLADAQKNTTQNVCMTDSRRTSKLFHDFKLNIDDAIVWVDTVDAFDDCVTQLMQYKLIGFDSEWRPSFTSINHKTELSILQLATDDKVFILDVVKLLKEMDVSKWENLFQSIFMNSQITIIGYGMREDLVVMSKSIPSLSHLISNLRVFDLESIHTKLVEESIAVGMPARSMSSGLKGLSDMVRRLFGVPLEKSQQISDWLRRPLKRKQLIYAALDAHCLIEIYERLLLKYPHLLNYQQKNIKKELKFKGEDRESISGSSLDARSTKSSDGMDLSFVCDNMLIGLGTALRKCGLDVAILKYTDEHHKALEFSNEEGRIILTNGNPYQKLKTGVRDASMIYCVNSVNKEDQLLEVLTHFSIKIDPTNIFKRCLVCNFDNYVMLNKDEMRYLWAVKRFSMGMSVPENFKYLQVNNDGRVVDTYRKDFAFEQLVEDEEEDDDDFEYINNTKAEIKSLPLKNKSSQKIKTRGFHDVDWKTATIKETAVTIHCEHLKMEKFANVNKFCVCAGCGKVYWVGLHHRKTQESLFKVFSES